MRSATRRLLRLAAIASVALTVAPGDASSQVRLRWSDGSLYLTGNAQVQAYYLFVPGRGNGDGTCQNFATYITVVNSTAKTLDFYANVDVGMDSACGSSGTLPIRGSVPPHGSIKVRLSSDFWVSSGDRPGQPGISFTDVRYR